MVNGDRSYFPATSSVTDSGIVYNANYDVFTIGAGYLDIVKTVNAALVKDGSVPAGTAMSPIAVYNSTTEQTAATVDPSALWTLSGPWSASSVYGNKAFIASDNGSTALWGKSSIWGDSDPDGPHCALGEDGSLGQEYAGGPDGLVGQIRGCRTINVL